MDTKARIKEAALQLFVRKGVAETTVRDLAHTAGIAEGTLYRHFTSMEELIRELFLEHYSAFGRRIEGLIASQQGLAAQLSAIVRDSYELFDTKPDLYRFVLLHQHEALSRLPKGADSPVRAVRTLMQAAIDADQLTIADADLATAIFFGMLIQPAMSMAHGGLQPPLSIHGAAVAQACKRTFVRH